jgi:phage FluMu protein Com
VSINGLKNPRCVDVNGRRQRCSLTESTYTRQSNSTQNRAQAH